MYENKFCTPEVKKYNDKQMAKEVEEAREQWRADRNFATVVDFMEEQRIARAEKEAQGVDSDLQDLYKGWASVHNGCDYDKGIDTNIF